MKPPASRCTPFRALSWSAWTDAVGLAAAIAAFSVLLWPAWRHDDNLTHGIFLPFLAIILVAESRRDPNPRFLGKGAGLWAAYAGLLTVCLLSFFAAVLYASALGWSHAMAEFLVSFSLVCLLGAAWLAFADTRTRYVPFNWAAAMAVAVWFFASPPPPGSYARLTFLLQTGVIHGVVGILNALGIAAFQDGNVIELARTSVGVSEACCGVRSLISCTVAGLVLSALLVRRPKSRAVIILVSPVIGLAMNFFRSLFLTLLANSGVNIEGRWHDWTGTCILMGTTLLVAALALGLQRLEGVPPSGEGDGTPSGGARSPLHGILSIALIGIVIVTGLFLLAAQPFRPDSYSEPDLPALLPAPPPGWTAQTTLDLDQYSEVLRTRTLVERVYSSGPMLKDAHVTLYLAYWRPGQAPVSLVDSHTPDACWPGTGWEPDPEPNAHPSLGIAGRTLPPAESRLFRHGSFGTHVWYWHLYGGRALNIVDPYSVTRILKLSLRYGFGHPEDQMFVRISSNQPWDEIASQAVVRQFVANLKSFGL